MAYSTDGCNGTLAIFQEPRMGRFFYRIGYMNSYCGQNHSMVAEMLILKDERGYC
jgi:hypothetical protein